MTISTNVLAQKITKNSSLQSYLTVKLLVDKPLQNDCFKAYAYFRWLDDQVDVVCKAQQERRNFIARQKQLIEDGYQKKQIHDICPEEQMIIELIATDYRKNSKLASFVLNFFAIIEFDAYRKDTVVPQSDLTWYTKTLATAVTDGIEHFINHSYVYPDSVHHYDAAIAAHLVHMLRDYHEDIAEGYFNISKDYLSKHNLQPTDTTAGAFKAWVKNQVCEARKHFKVGKQYINRLQILRGKIAASWYCARFEYLLDDIEADGFFLRPHYSRHGKLTQYLRMVQIAIKVVTIHLVGNLF